MGGKAGDWDDFPEKGRTLYLGSQSSPVRMRLYEKGLQPEYAHLNRPNWARIERFRCALPRKPKKRFPAFPDGGVGRCQVDAGHSGEGAGTAHRPAPSWHHV